MNILWLDFLYQFWESTLFPFASIVQPMWIFSCSFIHAVYIYIYIYCLVYAVLIFAHAVITSERSGRTFYLQSYIGHLDDIQTALELLKNS